MVDENFFKSLRIVDGKGSKPRLVIIDESENLVNKNPTNEELKELKIFKRILQRRNYSRKKVVKLFETVL